MEKEIIDAFRSSDVRIVETKFNDYDIYLKGTDIKIAIVSVERGIICVAVDGENYQFPVSKLDNAVQLVKDLVDSNKYTKNESISFREAKRILNENGYLLEESDDLFDEFMKIVSKFMSENDIDWSADYETDYYKQGKEYYKYITKINGNNAVILIKDGKVTGGAYAGEAGLSPKELVDLIKYN